MFEMLRLKAGGMTEMERECVLSLDEMSITPGMELYMGTGWLFGNVTLPEHRGQATHALVYAGWSYNTVETSCGLPL